MSSAPDADLVARCRRRDQEAFRQLVERHQDLVFAVALAHSGDPALAEDVAQEAFVAAWRDLDSLREPDRVGSWVAGIARNLAHGALRGRARARLHRLDEPPPPATPIDEVLAREDRELLARALAEVPAAHREALVLHYVEGQPVARIAEVLGVREDLVKQRLSRGRRALRTSVAARVEAALVRARPGPLFGAGVVALAAAPRAASAASAAGKGLAVMSMKKALVAAAAVAALAVAGGAVYMSRADGDEESGPTVPAEGQANRRPARAAGTAAKAAAATAVMVRRIDPATRTARLEAIRRARRAAGGGSQARAAGDQAPPALPPSGDMDKEYIREAVQGLIPLLAECYQEGLERNPTLAGQVTVDFAIEGEPEIGGVVGDSSIQKTSLDDPAVLECIQETMYGLEIDPPSDGGVVHVTYPFEFRPSDDEQPDR